ncbi:peptidoglycan DD-metalloendopeptidase family protein [Agrobacterium tumefaciens]|uniref:peptidoglycan DD-metalloendopeptidase family protein n=1 Tax=Agrobacterium tumefaciens TaxID=358 RepID=UPI001574B5BF|nr:peptidoglycan DD-metalloendopeptidase family protein [Agrobacterium tumefaciens]NTE55589.1 peptidoglycan DD-metalloendopeptidase family protein [Agrobacterium tumefaciens]NTE71613.1 peptidoglycan DD-metalloendopeptidase family protein [Agrobacterium tumefaciens]
MFAAALLASVATGCSSDATRFGGLFSSGPDQMTTASIPARQGGGAYAQAPVPQGDMNGGYASAAPQGGYANQNMASNSYPQSGGYGGVQPSTARSASASPVQRSELSAPTAVASRDPSTRNEAMAQPFPSAQRQAAPSLAAPARQAVAPVTDNLTTATVRSDKNGWHTDGASSVTLRPGESIATISNRYGVPEKELLRVNGLKSASSAQAGQSILIPKFGQVRNAAKDAAGNIALNRNGDQPTPLRSPEGNVAVLPSQAAARDKVSSEGGKLTPPGGKPLPPTGGYKVQPGDSLAKIARENGVSVAALKAANGLSNENIRIGQTLSMPGAGTDNVKTASVPAREAAAVRQVETASVKPEPYKAPAATATVPATPATASVSDIEKKADMASVAPESTGIGKYRWPVRGAVINNFGDNVEGSRNDGINISVPEGTPIKAAENGVVIYAGNGLKQLGNTVLVRHDDGKVTVYGNAANLDVQRGQKVQRGQTIATSGMTGSAKRPQVHFEVRKDATPVNPSGFLE